MKQALLLCALVAVVTVPAAWAGDTFVPDNNPTTGINNHFPFNAGWTGSNGEWRYQAIYTATHLGNKPFVITDISLSPDSTGTFTAKELEFRMSHTTSAPSATFATNLPNPVQVLHATNFTWNPQKDTWTPFALACPFVYNGVDSLTIEVRYRGGAISGGFNGPVKRVSGYGTRIYTYGTGAYTAASGSNGGTTAWKIRITHADLTPSTATVSIGKPISLLLDDSADAGKFYFCASSLGTGKIPLGCWTVDLAMDGLFFVTMLNLAPSVFQNYQGILDPAGQAKAVVNVPANPGLVGVKIASSYVVLGISFVDAVAPMAVFQIVK